MTYQIAGTPFPVVICELQAGEMMDCQAGAMAWMSSNVRMKTTAGGGLGDILTRVVTGESILQNQYYAENSSGSIAFRCQSPGEILALKAGSGPDIVAQKGAYLASECGVTINVTFQKSFGAAFFGGEGFVLQRFSGNGTFFLSIDGTVVDYTLAAGESMILDTGTFAAAESTVGVSVDMVKGVFNAFGGEGLFNTKVTGPGKIWMQTMPLSKSAKNVNQNNDKSLLQRFLQ